MRAAGLPPASVAILLTAVGCANLLSYDEYAPRTTDASTASDAPPVEAAVDGATAAETPSSDAGVHPPPRPAGATVPSGKGKTIWLVVNHFYLGQRDVSSGIQSKDAWRSIGYDIDHVCTGPDDAKANIGTCHRVEGAAQSVLLDGDDCRDNNFGSQFVPLASLADGEFERTSNTAVGDGVSTWLIELSDLDDGADDPYVVGKVYKAAAWKDYGITRPKFDGTDVRQIDAESVSDGDIDKPHTLFTHGYLASDVFVSGEPGDFEVSLPIQGIAVNMPLGGGVFVLRLNRAHTTGELGTIAGGIPRTALTSVLQPIAEQAGICPGDPLYVGLFNSIGKTMDLVVGAPQLRNTAVECNALSIGLGFTTTPVQPPVEVVVTPPPMKRCTIGDGGTG